MGGQKIFEDFCEFVRTNLKNGRGAAPARSLSSYYSATTFCSDAGLAPMPPPISQQGWILDHATLAMPP
jgi:hypothetical protein